MSEELRWRKSSFSGGYGECIRVAVVDDEVLVGDSKNPDGPVLHFTKTEFLALLERAKAGEFDDLVAET